MTVSSPPLARPGGSGATTTTRHAAGFFLACVLALAAGGGFLGLRVLQGGPTHAHTLGGARTSAIGAPVETSFGFLGVESVTQIRGLTPKALSGVTHGIQSLVRADRMQVQLVLALRNVRGASAPFDPADFRLRVVRPRKAPAYPSATTSVRAGVIAPGSTMETTLGFVIPRFNPRGTRLSLEYAEPGRPALALELGRARPGGSAANVRSLYLSHH